MKTKRTRPRPSRQRGPHERRPEGLDERALDRLIEDGWPYDEDEGIANYNADRIAPRDRRRRIHGEWR